VRSASFDRTRFHGLLAERLSSLSIRLPMSHAATGPLADQRPRLRDEYEFHPANQPDVLFEIRVAVADERSSCGSTAFCHVWLTSAAAGIQRWKRALTSPPLKIVRARYTLLQFGILAAEGRLGASSS
jgi:hypothetical protein